MSSETGPVCAHPSGFAPSLQPIGYCSFGFVPWSQSLFLLVPSHLESGTCTEAVALDAKTSVSVVITKTDLLYVGQTDTQAEQLLWGSSSDGASSLPTAPRPEVAAASGSTSQQ